MNDMFSFEPTPWELMLNSLQPGSTLSAVRFLSALEAEDETVLDQAFSDLTDKKITLDISVLPSDFGSGETEKQLRREAKLRFSGDLIASLEETDPLRMYLEELARTPAQGDPKLLAEALLDGDENAASKLANLYLNRAVELAFAYTGRGVLLVDLIQEASLGLWQGILQYEGGDLDATLDWWITQSIARTVTLHARENGVLRTMRANMEAYRQADQRLLTQLGRNATMEEIAVEMGLSAEQADLIRDMILNASAMEKAKQPPKTDDEEDQAVEDTSYFQSRQRVSEMLATLTDLEARILTLRFGLEGGKPETCQAVGAKLGLSADEVITIEAAALAKLRNE